MDLAAVDPEAWNRGGGVLEELNFQDQNHQSFYVLMLMLNWFSFAGRWSDSFLFFNWSWWKQIEQYVNFELDVYISGPSLSLQQSQNNDHVINRSPLQTFTLACYCEVKVASDSRC